MLSGYLPFDGLSTEDICWKVGNGVYNIKSGIWKSIS